MNEKKVYMDRDGYNAYLLEIELLKEKIAQNNAGRREAFDSGAGDGWDSPEFEEIERQERLLYGELQRMAEYLASVEIIEKHNNSDIIDIGDVLSVTLSFSSDPEDIDELTFKLVGANGNFDSDIKEISINSPLGSAVYKRNVGDNTSYTVKENTIAVHINQKLSLDMSGEQAPKKIR